MAALPESVRHDRSCFDFKPGPILDETPDFDNGHHRVVITNDFPIVGAKLLLAGKVVLFIGNKPGQPDQVFGASTRLGQDGDNILQCLRSLFGEIIAGEFFPFIPANLTCDDNDFTALRDTVTVSPVTFPAWWLK